MVQPSIDKIGSDSPSLTPVYNVLGVQVLEASSHVSSNGEHQVEGQQGARSCMGHGGWALSPKCCGTRGACVQGSLRGRQGGFVCRLAAFGGSQRLFGPHIRDENRGASEGCGKGLRARAASMRHSTMQRSSAPEA